MKLATYNNTGLMEISKITAEGSKLVVTGTIMGSVPVRAVLSGAEARKGLSLMGFRTMLSALRMLVFG